MSIYKAIREGLDVNEKDSLRKRSFEKNTEAELVKEREHIPSRNKIPTKAKQENCNCALPNQYNFH